MLVARVGFDDVAPLDAQGCGVSSASSRVSDIGCDMVGSDSVERPTRVPDET